MAENNPLVPDSVEQYAQVLDNINNAENLSDIPDPMDAAPDIQEPPEPKEKPWWKFW